MILPKECEYCTGHRAIAVAGHELAGMSDKIYVNLDGAQLKVFEEGENKSRSCIVYVNYCPMCGQKLQ